MYIYDTNHTIWKHISLCGVVMCNICARNRNLNTLYYWQLTAHHGLLVEMCPQLASKQAPRRCHATGTPTYNNYKWLSMIRFVQFGRIYHYVVSFHAIISQSIRILKHDYIVCLTVRFGIWQQWSPMTPRCLIEPRSRQHWHRSTNDILWLDSYNLDSYIFMWCPFMQYIWNCTKFEARLYFIYDGVIWQLWYHTTWPGPKHSN